MAVDTVLLESLTTYTKRRFWISKVAFCGIRITFSLWLGMRIWPVDPLRSMPLSFLKRARTLAEPVELSMTPDTVATLPGSG